MTRDLETDTGKADVPIEFVDSNGRRFVLEATGVCEYRRCRSRWTVVREFPYKSLIPEFSAMCAPSTNFMTGLIVIAGGIAIAALLRPFSRPGTPVGELLAAAVICFWVSGLLLLVVGRRQWTYLWFEGQARLSMCATYEQVATMIEFAKRIERCVREVRY